MLARAENAHKAAALDNRALRPSLSGIALVAVHGRGHALVPVISSGVDGGGRIPDFGSLAITSHLRTAIGKNENAPGNSGEEMPCHRFQTRTSLVRQGFGLAGTHPN